MYKMRKKSYLFIAMLTIIIVLMSSAIASIFISPNKALALTNTNSAVKAGNGAELWNSVSSTFNNVVLDDLVGKLFGNEDPVEYIKKYQDAQTGSYVVPASIINAKVGNATDGMTVMLGEKEWMVASLTLADIDGKNDNIIVTLYLADVDGTSQFYSSGTTTKGNSAYSRSIVRNHLLTDSKWSLFNQTGIESFASQFLVQPKYINYQYNQTAIGRGGPYTTHLPNEALGAFSTGWQNNPINYQPSDTFDGIRYDAWGEDYIWLPSMTETGATNRCNAGTESIWKLSANQVKHNGTSRAWWRTGNYMSYKDAYSLADNGESDGGNYVTNNYGVRPAIHLNLSSVAQTLVAPQDLETTYNGNEQTIKSIATATKADWYDKDIYEHVDNYINITYPNNVSYVKNADEYWVKIEITQNYINAVYAQVENEGLQNGWTQDFIDKLKTIRKPRFRGSPDTTDPDHLETDTIRWIKVTVNKAEIDFSNVKWSANSFEYNGQIQKVEISGLPSFLEPIYSDNAKTETGNYTAVVIGFNGSDPNYKTYTNSELSAISELRHDWKITPKRVAGIWTKQNITIDDITLAIPQLKVDDNMVNAIVYKYFRDRDFKDEVTLAQIFAENDISQIKSYWVQATFTTNSVGFNNVNCIFVVEGKELDSLEEVFQTGSVINKVNIILKNNKFTYNGNPQGIELDVVGGGLTINDLVLTYKTASGTMLSGLPTNAGMYKVSVGLKSGLTDFMIVGDDEFDFEIESLRIKKPKSNQLNIFDADGFGLNAVANMPANWQNYFTILVDGNPVDENWKFAKAGNYEIEIAFKNGINTANGGDCDNVIWDDDDNTNFNITLDIESLTFVIDGWNNGTGNNRPTLIAEDRAEIEKYFDYEIYQIRDDQIIGNTILPDATLRYNTTYQISLKVKSQYKDSVFLEYNGELVDETDAYKFKTDLNPNPSGGDGSNGEDDGNNGGNNGNAGGIIGGKLSIFDWILIAVVCFMALIILLMLIQNIRLNKNIKNLKLFRESVAPVNDKKENESESNATEKIEDALKNASIVNPYTVKNSDWTFVIKEKDVVNIDLLNAPTDRIMFYAFKEADAKGIKKFQSQLVENGKASENEMEKDTQNTISNKNKKQKNKK